MAASLFFIRFSIGILKVYEVGVGNEWYTSQYYYTHLGLLILKLIFIITPAIFIIQSKDMYIMMRSYYGYNLDLRTYTKCP